MRYEKEVERVKQSIVRLYSFPEQDHSLRTTPEPCDPDTGKPPGNVIEVGSRHVKIKRGIRSTAAEPHALIVGKPIDSKPLPERACSRLAKLFCSDIPASKPLGPCCFEHHPQWLQEPCSCVTARRQKKL